MASARSRRGARRLAAAFGKFVAITVAFVAVLIASAYFSMRWALLGRQVAVPDVTGMTIPEAQEALARQELFLEPAGERSDDRLERGRVLAQDPASGSNTKKFRKVKVVTSLGPRVFRIPDLAGQSLRTGLMKLESAGLKVGRIAYAHTFLGEPDVVIAQDPLPSGESLGEGGVSLLVSKGARQPLFVMPDLGGRRPEAARAALEARGLRIGAVRRARGAGAARGVIARQYPEAGYPVAAGDIVSLVVND